MTSRTSHTSTRGTGSITRNWTDTTVSTLPRSRITWKEALLSDSIDYGSIGRVFGRLGVLLLLNHLLLQAEKDLLDFGLSLPLHEAADVDGAAGLVDTAEVDLGDELDGGLLLGILVSADYLQRVDPVLEVSLFINHDSLRLALRKWSRSSWSDCCPPLAI